MCDSGLVRQPKWGHLRDVHKAIKMCEPALIATDPSYMSLGQNAEVCDLLFQKQLLSKEEKKDESIKVAKHKCSKSCPGVICTFVICLVRLNDELMISAFLCLQAHVYKTGSVCAAFLANIDDQSDKTVTFNGKAYKLPAWSVSILPDCKNVVLNTAQVCAFLA
jgi:hypothetical protein